jgi:hypothetical protein
MIRRGRWSLTSVLGGVAVAYEERGVGALPRLYGAPAYHRPPRPLAAPVARPFDPDDLPIEAVRTEDVVAPDVAPEEVPSSPWADMMAAMTRAGTDVQYHSVAAPAAVAEPVAAAVQTLEPPEPEPAAPAPTYPAEPVVATGPTVRGRLGGLFKGRGRGAS